MRTILGPPAVVCVVAALAALLLGLHRPASSAATEPRPWPAGTEFVPFELRSNQILVRANLVSHSGRDTTGLLVLDTGAPVFVLGAGVWKALHVDSVDVGWSHIRRVQRPLAALEMGSARVTGLEIGGVVDDSVLGDGVLGFFAPSFYQDRAIVIDYAAQRLAIVQRRLTMITGDTAASVRGGSLGIEARVRRSRSRYAEILTSRAVALPFRRFEGGRLLVNARIADPGREWRSPALTLLLDTGASSCVLFDDLDREVLGPLSRWPTQNDVPFRTVLGRFRHDAVLVPALSLTEASPSLQERSIATGVIARRSLPDIQGELPERVDGLLGNSFLARFRLVLDYGNDVAWLEPRGTASQVRATSHGQPSEVGTNGTVGLHVERAWGELRIAAVEPGSPAETAGIRAGDLLVAIDHARIGGLDEQAVERLLAGSPGAVVVVAVRRGGFEQIFRLERRGRRGSLTPRAEAR